MHWWRRQPLRVQLVVITVVLGAAALLVSGAVAAAALRDYLLTQMDEQLVQVATSPRGPGGGPDRGGGGYGMLSQYPADDDDGPGRGLPAEFYIEYQSASGAVQVLSRPLGGGAPDIPTLTQQQAAAQAGAPFTVAAADGSGSWRAIAVPAQGGVLSFAKPLAEVESTVTRLMALEAVVGLVVLAALAVAATFVVRRNLRPLVEVEQTATAIAAGDLTRRVPPSEQSTEVGQLSDAVNGMLDEISRGIDERDRALAEARASEERMRQFVADASHELRTPLTSIRGYAELFRQGGIGEPDVPATFARVENESQRMAGLVDDLLLLARLDQQRPLERTSVDLLALANDVVHGARAAYPERAVALSAKGDEVPVVMGDESRLQQVVANIVGNALKYTTGPVRISVATQRAVVCLAVADQGPGIRDSDKARVFERFYRGDVSRTRTEGGAGLGLSIVAAIVKAHHGTVTVRDNAGGGAVFEVCLPRTT